MLNFHVILADTVLVGHYDEESGNWKVRMADMHKGNCWDLVWTPQQLSAIMALGMGGLEESGSGFDIAELYKVASSAMPDYIPRISWPIP